MLHDLGVRLILRCDLYSGKYGTCLRLNVHVHVLSCILLVRCMYNWLDSMCMECVEEVEPISISVFMFFAVIIQTASSIVLCLYSLYNTYCISICNKKYISIAI